MTAGPFSMCHPEEREAHLEGQPLRESLDDALQHGVAFVEWIDNEGLALAPRRLRIDADGDLAQGADVQARRADHADVTPDPALLELFLEPIAQAEVTDLLGDLGRLVGDAFLGALPAHEHEPGSGPFGSDVLHALDRFHSCVDCPVAAQGDDDRVEFFEKRR